MRQSTIMILATLSTLLVVTSVAAMSPEFVQSSRSNTFQSGKNQHQTQRVYTTKQLSSSSQHETTMSLNAATLSQPHRLEIRVSPGAQLTGQVTLNGRLIQDLSRGNISLDLAPYLSRGQQTVEIAGRYQPGTASVQIEFSGPNATVVQQSSGTGLLQHRLNLEIQ